MLACTTVRPSHLERHQPSPCAALDAVLEAAHALQLGRPVGAVPALAQHTDLGGVETLAPNQLCALVAALQRHAPREPLAAVQEAPHCGQLQVAVRMPSSCRSMRAAHTAQHSMVLTSEALNLPEKS